jgi:acylphosphatase
VRRAAARQSAAVSALQVFYEGHVQGVGFRWSIKQIARGFDVSGFVRNLPDGRVELQASGADEEVRAFLNAIGESELRSLIKSTSEHPLPQPVNLSGFTIRS